MKYMNKITFIFIALIAIALVSAIALIVDNEYLSVEESSKVTLNEARSGVLPESSQMIIIDVSDSPDKSENQRIAQAIVDVTSEAYLQNNLEYVNDKFLDYPLTNGDTRYSFVLDPETKTVVAHPNAERIGLPSIILNNSIENSTLVLEKLQEKGDAWVHYNMIDPQTNQLEFKLSWLEFHDDLIFGSGFYTDSTYDKEREIVKEVVNRVIENYEETDLLFSNKLTFTIDEEHSRYVWVHDAKNLLVVAHPNPDNLGKEIYDLADIQETLDDLKDQLNKEGVAWIHYSYLNPDTGNIEHKEAYLKLHEDGIVFGSGYYYTD